MVEPEFNEYFIELKFLVFFGMAFFVNINLFKDNIDQKSFFKHN